ncbi:glycosyl hydrolase 108 family protein [Pedobacter sp. L105]|uniref:glycosyl hydrolase 108 family protein n=1 Tax=Pedobacter sp. L105 TaxID=1641871 RepID=UPI00131ACC7C|nr:glycosyl hydrolase 108 family protein [Pedobacter sp. L105]
MADYKIAAAETGENEGLYANNPNDRGGETWAGIARNFWPGSKIFTLIDQIKKDHLPAGANVHLRSSWLIINKYAQADPELKGLVAAFYKINFWNVNSLDYVNDQQLANSVYDFGVNSGTHAAGDKLQDAYNNVRGNLPALINDGDIGSKTLFAVNSFPAAVLYAEYNRLRETYYRSLAQNPTQKQFLSSWLSRLKPYRSAYA